MLETLHTQSKRLLYRLRRDFLTLNNVVIVVALLIALNWTWNSIEVMQQNYELQQSVDAKRRQVELERPAFHLQTYRSLRSPTEQFEVYR